MNDDGPTHNPDDVLRRMLGAQGPASPKLKTAQDVQDILNAINSPLRFAQRPALIAELKAWIRDDLFQDDAARRFAKHMAEQLFLG